MTQSPYSHYSPYRTKSADIFTVPQSAPILNVGNFSPFQSQLANYGAFAGGGGLAGAGIGALIQALRGESKLKGALIGGGIGAGAGVGVKGLADILAPNAQGILRDYIRSGYLEDKAKKQDAKDLSKYRARTADTWSNYIQDIVFGAPTPVTGTENADEQRAGADKYKALSIFDAIKQDDSIRHGRAFGDAMHGIDDWWKAKNAKSDAVSVPTSAPEKPGLMGQLGDAFSNAGKALFSMPDDVSKSLGRRI